MIFLTNTVFKAPPNLNNINHASSSKEYEYHATVLEVWWFYFAYHTYMYLLDVQTHKPDY